MALIGEIRSRSWILIVFIGLGMGGFLLMDMIGNNSNVFGNSSTVGEIAGKDISITEFQRRKPKLVPAQSLVKSETFWVLHNGQKSGPLSLAELKEKVDAFITKAKEDGTFATFANKHLKEAKATFDELNIPFFF